MPVCERGESHSPPPFTLPHSNSPALLLWCLPGARAGQDLGVHQADLCSTSGCPSGAWHLSSVTHGTPLVSPGRRGIGLHPDLGKCLQFFLSELRALCPPIRFLRGTGCSLRLGIQPSSVEREGFPHLGSSVLLPSRNPPFRMVPRLFRSALFPGRVSLPLGSPVCPARLIPLRCIWVMSLSSAIGSCCRA